MKRFNVTVNGVVYDVCVEEVGGNTAPAAVPAAPATAVAAPAAAPAAAPTAASTATPAKPAQSGAEGANKILAPMPGTIVKVNVSEGATVKKGDVLVVLEAMKMENDICAPEDGTVASVNVSKGASVNTDEVLVTLN